MKQKSNQLPQPPPPYDPAWDSYGDTVGRVQPIRPPLPRRKPMGCCSLFLTVFLAAGLISFILLLGYFLAPLRTNLLILGIDRTPDGSAVGRSDTIILTSIVPLRPDVAMLSIPRDLWVNIPGVGENRINTAHFFAEAEQVGSGPAAAARTVEANFEVDVPYYVRIRFDSFMKIVDAMGGVKVTLPYDMIGLPAGEQHLNSEQALAFVRDRQGADDFFRMEHGQILLRAILRQLIEPDTLQNLPQIAQAVNDSVDTNLPFWHFPRLGLAVLRAGPDGIDSRTIQREMTVPYTTDAGAQVLLPEWEQINPVVDEMFGQ